MRARARAFLQSELYESAAARMLLMRMAASSPAMEDRALGQAVPLVLADRDCLIRILNQTPGALTTCVWGELVERLIEQERCTFDLIGRFEVADGARYVRFHAGAVFGGGIPQLTHVFGDEFATEALAVQKAMSSAFDQWSLAVTRERKGEPTTFNGALILALKAIMETGAPTMEVMVHGPASLTRWSSFLAIANYYSLAIAVADRIARIGRFHIAHIGALVGELDVVSFNASPDLLRLLSAHLPTTA
jgi:hypothetical protein